MWEWGCEVAHGSEAMRWDVECGKGYEEARESGAVRRRGE